MSEPTGDLAALTDWIGRRQRLFVLTGAGCSTGSGIPDYRDRLGRWKRPQPVQFQDFLHRPAVRRRYWARSLVGWTGFARARPGPAHHALAQLESTASLGWTITQNVDRLHQRAGQQRVIDLHGRIDRLRCLGCRRIASRAGFQRELLACNPDYAELSADQAPDGDADLERADFDDFQVPQCRHCGGLLKPDVVFFGESVPRDRVEQAEAALRESDGLLVLGSSLMVYSGLRFCRQAQAAGLPIAIVNQGRTRADALADLRLQTELGATLAEVARRLSGAASAGPGG